MTTAKRYIIGVLIILVKLTAIDAEVDCSQDPPPMNFNYCCELSNVLSHELKNKCIELEYGDNNNPSHKSCFLSCVINQTGILVNDELQLDNLDTYLYEAFVDSEKVGFLRNKFIQCHEQLSVLLLNISDASDDSNDCEPKHFALLLGCVNVQAFIDCPDSSWLNIDNCNVSRDYVKQCQT
ncbi:general odorant-binding protein 68-like [Lucilia sericata]|uniref:general odorant-binding protein 68-like n=1 Tax=Lucilia sericata TaxID=13632 RepID=UPI0018A7F9C0|nr:general odorant-binding protein 68-like [Lucilia sericata]